MTNQDSNTPSNSKDAASKWAGAASITSLSSGKKSTSKPDQPRSGMSNSRWATADAQDKSANDTRPGKAKYGQQKPAPVPHAPASQQKGTSSKWANAASVTSLSTGKRETAKATQPSRGMQTSRFAAPPVEEKPAVSTAAAYAPAPQPKPISSKWANAASMTSLSTGKRETAKATQASRSLQTSRFAASPVEEKPAAPTIAASQAASKQDGDESEPERSEGLKLLAEMNRRNREKLLGSAKNGSLQLLKSKWADPEVKEKKSEDYRKMLEEEKDEKKDEKKEEQKDAP